MNRLFSVLWACLRDLGTTVSSAYQKLFTGSKCHAVCQRKWGWWRGTKSRLNFRGAYHILLSSVLNCVLPRERLDSEAGEQSIQCVSCPSSWCSAEWLRYPMWQLMDRERKCSDPPNLSWLDDRWTLEYIVSQSPKLIFTTCSFSISH